MKHAESNDAFHRHMQSIVRNTTARLSSFERIIILYWFLFWILNGMDKFLNGRDLLLFKWHGKNRTLQFTSYFDRTELPKEWINSFLYVIGLWELTLSVFFLAAVILILRKVDGQKIWKAMRLGLLLSASTFIGFSAVDIIIGDRGELLEHGVFLGLVIVSWLVIIHQRERAAESPSTTVNSRLPAPAIDEADQMYSRPIPTGHRYKRTEGVDARSRNGHNGNTRGYDGHDLDERMIDQARDIALRNPHVSSGYMTRRFKIEEERANQIMEALEEEGLVIPIAR